MLGYDHFLLALGAVDPPLGTKVRALERDGGGLPG